MSVMARLAPFFAASLLIAGCQEVSRNEIPLGATIPESTVLPPHQLTQDEVLMVQEGIRRNLKDPTSPLFGTMLAGVESHGGILVCGLVNAKNSFGGYTGNHAYVGVIATQKTGDRIFVPFSMDESATKQEVILNQCLRAGLVL